MKAREVQAENIAKKLIHLSYMHELPIVIMGKSYKPGVDYVEGSTSIMVGHFCENQGYTVSFDDIESKAVYLLGHYKTFNQIIFPEGSVILDPWREYESKTNIVFYYG